MSFPSLEPEAQPDKRWVRRSFAAAAGSYDGTAGLQRSIGERFLDRLPGSIRAGEWIVDVGAGTGYFAERMKAIYPGSRVIALDIAEGMLRAARKRFNGCADCDLLCGDAEALPLADRSIDLIFSNLALQWCSNLGMVFREFRRVLKPGGTAWFSTFGVRTLTELRNAWAAVDGYSHVNAFMDKTAVAEVLQETGFSDAELDGEDRYLHYPDVYALMRELKGLGAHNVTSNRPRHLIGKRRLQNMIAAYETRREIGGIPAGFEVIYGCARKGVAEP